MAVVLRGENTKKSGYDGSFHLLAIDVDGYPAGAALCHKPVVCGKDASNIRHWLGR